MPHRSHPSPRQSETTTEFAAFSGLDPRLQAATRSVKNARILAGFFAVSGSVAVSLCLQLESPSALTLLTSMLAAVSGGGGAIALWLLAKQLADLEEHARQSIRQSEQRRHCLLNAGPVAILRVDADNKPIEWNQQLSELWGPHPCDAAPALINQPDWQSGLPRLIEATRSIASGGLVEIDIFRNNGSLAWLELRRVPCQALAPTLPASSGRHTTTVAPADHGPAWLFIRDVTQQRDDEFQMRLSRQALESISEGIMITDASSRIIHVNPGFEKLTGYHEDEIIGLRPSILKSSRQPAEFFKAMWCDLNNAGHWDGELWNRHKDGHTLPCRMHIDALRDAGGQITHYVGVLSDISAQKQVEARFSYMAHHDALTDLPNRLALHALLPQATALAQREGYRIAVCYLDLDGFKQVNDDFGHQAGDALLVAVSQRLKQCVRASDNLARIGGDEFIIVIHQVGERADVERVMTCLANTLLQPVSVKQDVDIVCTPSIGIALFPDHGSNPEELLNHSDRAMYAVKAAKKSGYAFYEPDQPEHHDGITHWGKAGKLDTAETVIDQTSMSGMA